MVSLPARVPTAHHVWKLTELLTNRTEASPINVFTPPEWRLLAVYAASRPVLSPIEQLFAFGGITWLYLVSVA